MIKIENALEINTKNEFVAKPKYNKNRKFEYEIINIQENNLNINDEYYYINRPEPTYFIPKSKGLNKSTQIPRFDWELHDFDIEVKPIIEVLIGKTLELSRMELIEEYEKDDKLKKRKKFEIIKNGELMTTQRLDNEHLRLNMEKNRRKMQKEIYYENLKKTHRKLFSKKFSVNFLKNSKDIIINKLKNKGILNDPKCLEIRNNNIDNIFNNIDIINQNKKKTQNYLDNLINIINEKLINQHNSIINNHNNQIKLKNEEIIRLKHEKKIKREKELKLKKIKEEYEEKMKLKEEYENKKLKINNKEVGSVNEMKIESIHRFCKESSTTIIGGLLGEIWLILDSYDNYFDIISNVNILKFMYLFFKDNPNLILNIHLENYLEDDIEEIYNNKISINNIDKVENNDNEIEEDKDKEIEGDKDKEVDENKDEEVVDSKDKEADENKDKEIETKENNKDKDIEENKVKEVETKENNKNIVEENKSEEIVEGNTNKIEELKSQNQNEPIKDNLENFNLLWSKIKFKDHFLNYIKEKELLSQNSIKKFLHFLLRNKINNGTTVNNFKDEEEKKEEIFWKKILEKTKFIFNKKPEATNEIEENLSEQKNTNRSNNLNINKIRTNKTINLDNEYNEIDINNIKCILRNQYYLNKFDKTEEEMEAEIDEHYSNTDIINRFKRKYLYKEHYIKKKDKIFSEINKRLYSDFYNFDGSLYQRELKEFGELNLNFKLSFMEYNNKDDDVIIINRVNQRQIRAAIIKDILFEENKSIEDFSNFIEGKYIILENNIINYIKSINEEFPIFDYEIN